MIVVLGRTGIGKSELISKIKQKYDQKPLQISSAGSLSHTKQCTKFTIDSLNLCFIDTAGFLDSEGEGKEYEVLLELFKELGNCSNLKGFLYLVDRVADVDFIIMKKFLSVMGNAKNMLLVQNKVNLDDDTTMDMHVLKESQIVKKKNYQQLLLWHFHCL